MKTLLTCFFALMTLTILAQKNPAKSPSPNDLKKMHIRLANQPAVANFRFPFKKITIRDLRFDTTKIGFAYKGMGTTRSYKKLCLQGGLAESLQGYLNNRYSRSLQEESAFELLIDVKKFWISSIRLPSADRAAGDPGYTHPKLYAKWEYYLVKNDEYLPLLRKDTVIEISTEMLGNTESNTISSRYPELRQVLNYFIESVDFATAAQHFESRTKTSLAKINDIARQRFDLPILQLQKIPDGNYGTFRSFVNAVPTTEAAGEGYYAKVKDEVITCNVDESLRLYRVGETFEFFTLVPVWQTQMINLVRRNPGGPDNAIKLKSQVKTWMPLQIDMETGLPY